MMCPCGRTHTHTHHMGGLPAKSESFAAADCGGAALSKRQQQPWSSAGGAREPGHPPVAEMHFSPMQSLWSVATPRHLAF